MGGTSPFVAHSMVTLTIAESVVDRTESHLHALTPNAEGMKCDSAKSHRNHHGQLVVQVDQRVRFLGIINRVGW